MILERKQRLDMIVATLDAQVLFETEFIQDKNIVTYEHCQEKMSSEIGMIRPLGYRTFFMLNVAEHEIYHTQRC